MLRRVPGPRPIMLLARALDLGGSERQLTEIAKALDRFCWEPHVGCFDDSGVRAEELRSAGVPVMRLPIRSFRLPLAASWRFGKYLSLHRIALVHAFDTPTNLFSLPSARAFRCPVVLASQRSYRTLRHSWERHLLRVTDHLVDGLIVNCRAVERHLIEEEKVPPHLIRVCYNGIDTCTFSPGETPRPSSLNSAACVIGTVCVLRPEKGLPTLMKAFARLHPLHANLKLLIVGSGPMLGELQALSQQLGFAGDCLFEPATSKVASWLRATDIFVLPSLSEAFSNALAEAMACGCCAVASCVGGVPELISHGHTGLLFRPGDAVDLAEKLRLVIEQDALRRQLALEGTRLVRERFTIAHAARRMEQIYEEFLAQRATL
jgi:glycosyltransferase involved in cell wall biosynthesis